MEERPLDLEKEVREGRISIQNVIAAYLIELVETRAYYISSLKEHGSPPPSHFKSFFIAFNKFYHFCASVIDGADKEQADLKKDVENWFMCVKVGDNKKCADGIDLSIKFQRFIEDEGILPLFEEVIVPPYLEE